MVASMGRRLTGRLLVASPVMRDPNFDRTVVLMLEHGDGAVGVGLNRASHVHAAQILPELDGRTAEPGTVHVGGPVQPEAAICLVRLARPESGPSWSHLFGNVGSVNLDRPLSELGEASTGLRLFAGYSGWAAGQLEDEIEAGGWLVLGRRDEDTFSAQPGALWREVLRRQKPQIAMLAAFPDDPGLN
jgi:putative transcriptional regulator